MLLIAEINRTLQKKIPGQVGRYNDVYNETVCDTFSKMVFQHYFLKLGHIREDYSRSFSKDILLIYEISIKLYNK